MHCIFVSFQLLLYGEWKNTAEMKTFGKICTYTIFFKVGRSVVSLLTLIFFGKIAIAYNKKI